MMKRLDTTPTFFSPADGAEAAAAASAGDPDWAYLVRTDPSGRSAFVRVEVLDEDGEHVAWL